MPFKYVFTPFRLGPVELRNRIVSTPHATKFGKDGYVTERYIRYHAEKARGGAGLVQCFGSMSLHPSSPVFDWGGIKNWDDSSLPTFREFASRIHTALEAWRPGSCGAMIGRCRTTPRPGGSSTA